MAANFMRPHVVRLNRWLRRLEVIQWIQMMLLIAIAVKVII